ncbi:MAG TPA: helix-turn-helix domain-containing protein [Pseudonocardiaceae bacterium]|nr:helix-turn-helix domain-containing protein [Pseudonocardiaceae bacterium]
MHSSGRRPLTVVGGKGADGRRATGDIGSSGDLWATMPREIALRFKPHASRIARDVMAEIRRAVPEYTDDPDSRLGKLMTRGVHAAIAHCIDSVGKPEHGQSEWADALRQRGRLEFREGRTMDSLQAAYRVGGRAAWRAVSAIGMSMGIPTAALSVGAEAIFAFVNDISILSLEGYAAEQARAAGTFDRRRQRLSEMILQQPPASSAAIAELAKATNWPLPERLCVVALEPSRDGDVGAIGVGSAAAAVDDEDLPLPEFDLAMLVDLESAQPTMITADPETHLRDFSAELPGWRAVVGPDVPVAEAPKSLQWARRALGLVHTGAIADDPVVWCRDHLSTMWLLTDELLVGELAKRSLAPLADLSPNQRARLAETLLSWLETRGAVPEIAKALDVHPQTVRYRMRQLEALFGDRLNNPDERLEMELSLRGQKLLSRPEDEKSEED